jgi:DNA polymerase-3 subunit beta
VKARIDRRQLAAALKTVLPAVPKSGGLPVLSGVRIDIGADAIALTCSNLDLTIETHVDVEADEQGTCIAPAALLTKIIGALPGGVIELVHADQRLTVTAGETVAELACHDPAGWPQATAVDGDTVTFGMHDLEAMTKIICCAAPATETRSYLSAVQFKGSRVNATDSYRLAILELGDAFDMPEALVPADALRTVLTADVDEVALSIGEGAVTFKAGPSSWTTRTIQGDYPDFARAIPADPPFSMTFDGDDMAEAVRRIGTLGHEIRIVKLSVTGMLATLEGWANSTDRGKASMTDTVPVDTDYDGAPVGLNGSFFADLLDAMGELVTLRMVSDMKPIVAVNDRITHVLVPTRLDP